MRPREDDGCTGWISSGIVFLIGLPIAGAMVNGMHMDALNFHLVQENFKSSVDEAS